MPDPPPRATAVPTLTLPARDQTGVPVIDQDIRLIREFVFKEKYRVDVFYVELARCEWIHRRENVLALGNPDPETFCTSLLHY